MGDIRQTPLRGLAVSYTPMGHIERVFEERSQRLYENDGAGSVAYAFWVGVTVIIALGMVVCSVPIAAAVLIRHLFRQSPRSR